MLFSLRYATVIFVASVWSTYLRDGKLTHFSLRIFVDAAELHDLNCIKFYGKAQLLCSANLPPISVLLLPSEPLFLRMDW